MVTLANPVTARNSGTCALVLASAGTHVLTATYSGDTVYRASSGTLDEAVALPPPEPAPTLGELALALLSLLLCAATLASRRKKRA
jgi:hypothetical protein